MWGAIDWHLETVGLSIACLDCLLLLRAALLVVWLLRYCFSWNIQDDIHEGPQTLWRSVAKHLGQKLVQNHFRDLESRSSCMALRQTGCLGRTWVPVATLWIFEWTVDCQWQKMEFSGLVLLQCHWVEGGYLKDVKPRLKLLEAGIECDFLHVWGMCTWLDGNVMFIPRDSQQCLAPWLAKEGMVFLSTSCLEHLCSQKLIFVDLGLGVWFSLYIA